MKTNNIALKKINSPFAFDLINVDVSRRDGYISGISRSGSIELYKIINIDCDGVYTLIEKWHVDCDYCLSRFFEKWHVCSFMGSDISDVMFLDNWFLFVVAEKRGIHSDLYNGLYELDLLRAYLSGTNIDKGVFGGINRDNCWKRSYGVFESVDVVDLGREADHVSYKRVHIPFNKFDSRFTCVGDDGEWLYKGRKIIASYDNGCVGGMCICICEDSDVVSSRYWFTDEGLYRESGHWGEVRSCRWYLNGGGNVGFIRWSDLIDGDALFEYEREFGEQDEV